jgi:hypothetical protein
LRPPRCLQTSHTPRHDPDAGDLRGQAASAGRTLVAFALLKHAVGLAALTEEIWMSDEDMKAELERLRAENSRLKQRGSRGVSMKVSEKGGVSIYGLGRFPVTLYKEQWEKLLDMSDDIRAFILENASKLKIKEDENAAKLKPKDDA